MTPDSTYKPIKSTLTRRFKKIWKNRDHVSENTTETTSEEQTQKICVYKNKTVAYTKDIGSTGLEKKMKELKVAINTKEKW